MTAVGRRVDDPGAIIVPIAGAAMLAVRSVLEWALGPGLLVAFCVGLGCLALLGGEVARADVTKHEREHRETDHVDVIAVGAECDVVSEPRRLLVSVRVAADPREPRGEVLRDGEP